MKAIQGWAFPDSDELCAGALLADVALVRSHWAHFAGERRVCVQAGGNCGIYPAALAEIFGVVYTFEPDADNFRCLVANCKQPNVYAFRAALGEKARTTGLHRVPNNVGMHWLEGDGTIPVLRIDDLGLPACDLIALDIEGAELLALEGAATTIERERPTVIVEEKDHSERFGTSPQAVTDWLRARGYTSPGHAKRDRIWLASERIA